MKQRKEVPRKYDDLCRAMEQGGPFMTNAIGMCRRHQAGFAIGAKTFVNRLLKQSMTYDAFERGERLDKHFRDDRAEPGYLIWLDDRKNNRKTHLPVMVDEESEIVKQVNGEYYGYLADVFDCLYYKAAEGTFVHWNSRSKGKTKETVAPYIHTDAEIAASDSSKSTVGTEVAQVARRKQGEWRKRVERLYGSVCMVTGCSVRELLRGSHIKPWAGPNATTKERLDEHNGLILIAHIDAAFDKGLVSFSDSGELLFSKRFPKEEIKRSGFPEHHRIPNLTAKTRDYLRWHRKNYKFE